MIDTIITDGIQKIKGNIKADLFTGKNVLITGGAGFIGSWLCDVLLSYGAEVTAVDDLSTGRIKNINHLVGKNGFNFLKLDISNFDSEKQFDVIFHLAGHASPDEYQAHPIETLRTSSEGSYRIAELARKNDAIVLFTSTSEAYGDTELIPTPESYWGNVNPVGPRSCYDEGKRFAEALFVAYYKEYGLDVKIARIFNTYGPRLREDGFYGRVISRFILQALTNQPITVYGNGKQTRSFTYVTDTATGLLLLANCQVAKGETINIGNIQETTILELANMIKEITGTKSEINFSPLPKDDPKRRCPDIRKIEKLTGWKPTISFDEGLRKIIFWFQHNCYLSEIKNDKKHNEIKSQN